MAQRTDPTAKKAALERMVGRLGPGRVATLGELFAEAGVKLDRPTARALAADACILVRNVATVGTVELESVHVTARDGAEAALQGDPVLVGILRRLAITGKARAHPVGALVAAVAKREQPAFRAALTARTRDRRWPDGVGALVAARGALLVFLLEDVVGGARVEGFARAFGEAFDRLRGERGLNLVALSALRSALGSWSRDGFDRELEALRRANQVVLHTSDGRHGQARPEELAAAIDEGGRRFVYAARRDPP